MSENRDVMNVENNDVIANVMGTLEDRLKKDKVLMNLSAEYLSLDEGESKKLVYIQMLSQEGVDEETGEIINNEVALFVDEDKKTYVHKGVVIKNAVRSLPNGTTLLITASGQKDLGKGRKLNQFDVELLG